jgi:hypothetical protein
MFERQDPFALLTAALMPEAYGDTRFYEETYGPIPDGAELTRRLDAALILEATGVVPTAGRVVTMSQTLVSMGYTTTQPVIHRPF